MNNTLTAPAAHCVHAGPCQPYCGPHMDGYIADGIFAGMIARRTAEATAAQTALLIPAAPSATPATCTRCDDTGNCLGCNGNGEIYNSWGLLKDCRDCDGHGVCRECVVTEEDCFGGFNCLCQLQAPCVPAVYAS